MSDITRVLGLSELNDRIDWAGVEKKAARMEHLVETGMGMNEAATRVLGRPAGSGKSGLPFRILFIYTLLAGLLDAVLRKPIQIEYVVQIPGEGRPWKHTTFDRVARRAKTTGE